MSTHQKLSCKLNGSKFLKVWLYLKSQTNGTHLAVVFRKLKSNYKLEQTDALYIPVKVEWNIKRRIAILQNDALMKALSYKKLNAEESIGIIWSSCQLMFYCGAHSVLIVGIHSIDRIVYSVIDNGEFSNEYNSDGTIIYCGYNSIAAKLSGLNLSLAYTGISKESFRFYIGSSAKSNLRPTAGYKLLNLYYIVSFWYERTEKTEKTAFVFSIEKKLRGNVFNTQKKLFVWRFLLSLNPSTDKQLSEMKDTFNNNL